MIQVVLVVGAQVAEVESHHQPKKKQIAQIAATKKIRNQYIIQAMNPAR